MFFSFYTIILLYCRYALGYYCDCRKIHDPDGFLFLGRSELANLLARGRKINNNNKHSLYADSIFGSRPKPSVLHPSNFHRAI
jgi:hypothetical protein